MRASFIVPCYNVSKTLCRCLDSIYALGLSEKDFEVLAIDDASTDDTLRLLEGYAGERPNMRIIRHLVNRNLGAARNSGLAEAKGDCIAFVDSDDEVAAGIVEAIRMLEMQNLDMVAMRVEKVKEDGTVDEILSLAYPQDRVFSGIQLQEEHPFWCSAVWGYLFSRTFINSVNYPFVEGVYYEDSDFVCRHLYQAGRMGFSEACGYRFFFSNPASITHTLSPKHVFGYAYLGVRMLSFYEGLEEKTSIFAESILEGGCYNLMQAFRRLPRLGSISDVRGFYNLFDSRIERNDFRNYKESAKYWTWWTKLGLRHRGIMVLICGSIASMHFGEFMHHLGRKKLSR